MKDVQLRSHFMSYVSGKSLHERLHCDDLEGEMTWRPRNLNWPTRISNAEKNCTVLTSMSVNRKGIDVGQLFSLETKKEKYRIITKNHVRL